MAARSITTDSRVGRVARPAFEVVGVIIDQAAVAAEARPFAAGAQLLQLARTDAEVMGRLRGVELGTPRRPQTICLGRHCFSLSCNFARQVAYRTRKIGSTEWRDKEGKTV